VAFALANVLREIVWQRKPMWYSRLVLRTQIDFDVAQRLAVGQLREGHREELVQTLKSP
jgi:hypothetical protein